MFLHIGVFGSLVVVLDFDRTPDIAMPLAINATLVTENAVVIPPKAEDPPKVAELPPEPDTSKQERLAAEQQKREADARVERERLQKIERAKTEAEAEKRRKLAEAEAEKKRLAEAEKKRLADIERQRLENERLRKEAETAARQQELDKEAQRVAAMTASAKSAYIFAIQQKISRNWVRPANAALGLECTIKVQQQPGGEVTNVSFGACNGDATIQRSIESAVYKASPLPAPRDPSVFDRNLTLLFKPEE